MATFSYAVRGSRSLERPRMLRRLYWSCTASMANVSRRGAGEVRIDLCDLVGTGDYRIEV